MKKTGLILSIGALLSITGCNNNANKTFEITWEVNGDVIVETYHYGETPTFKYGTEKDSDETYIYTFKGWDKEVVPATEDTTYVAEYDSTYIDYVVTWVTAKDTVTENYHYGDTPSFKGDTSKNATAEFTYTFKGWDKDIETVKDNVTYTAIYEETRNSYTVTWVIDGVKEVETYLYGELPSYKKTPTKEKDAQYSYTFKSWDKDIEIVTKDETYTAVFNSTINKYNVTWVVGNQETIEEYEYGVTPTFKGDTSRQGSAKYSYTFKGWDKEIVPATKDTTYVALYDEVINKYTINFYNEDGSVLLESKKWEYDSIPSYSGITPSKESTVEYTYLFDGWTSEGVLFEETLPSVINETNYYAHFKQEGKKYNVKLNCYDISGNLIKSVDNEVSYNSTYSLAVPEIENKKCFVKNVDGFVTGDANISLYYSDIDVYDGTSVSESLSGTGEENDPYIVASGADLAFIKTKVSEGEFFANKYFKLTKSIDLTNAADFVIGTSGTNSFKGILNGSKCVIYGFNINKTSAGSALFCALGDGGEISNITVDGTVIGRQYTGSIVGRNLGTLKNIINYSTVTNDAANGVGGICGGGTGTILGCINYGTIHSNATVNSSKKALGKVGGIIGALESGSTIEGSVNYGSVSGYSMVGGITGENAAGVSITNCANFGEITTSKERVGGIIGNNFGTISYCVNNGKVKTTATSGSVYIGGIAATGNATSTITNCINNGEVSGKGLYYGGILGCTASTANVTIEKCTNNGIVNTTGNGAGGILGGNLSSTTSILIKDCTNNGSITGGVKSGLLAGVLMPSIGTYENFTNSGTLIAGGNESTSVVGSES